MSSAANFRGAHKRSLVHTYPYSERRTARTCQSHGPALADCQAHASCNTQKRMEKSTGNSRNRHEPQQLQLFGLSEQIDESEKSSQKEIRRWGYMRIPILEFQPTRTEHARRTLQFCRGRPGKEIMRKKCSWYVSSCRTPLKRCVPFEKSPFWTAR